MATLVRCRRAIRRHRIPDGRPAVIEFVHPAPNGPRFSLPLVDVSVSGLSFSAGPELNGVRSGTTMAAVVVRIGGCELHGELLVMHITPHTPERRVVGALFYPAQDVDLVKWKSVVAGIDVAQSD